MDALAPLWIFLTFLLGDHLAGPFLVHVDGVLILAPDLGVCIEDCAVMGRRVNPQQSYNFLFFNSIWNFLCGFTDVGVKVVEEIACLLVVLMWLSGIIKHTVYQVSLAIVNTVTCNSLRLLMMLGQLELWQMILLGLPYLSIVKVINSIWIVFMVYYLEHVLFHIKSPNFLCEHSLRFKVNVLLIF